jgi:hypothetical protein
MNEFKTCTYTNDTGRGCKSAAATGREFCGYHLHYRGRLLRMAKYRARHQRFDITLPPLDSLCSIHSALSQVAEALAADMIDPRRAQGLLKALRFAKENLRDGLKDDNAHWHDTPYHSEDATAFDNFEADYGLPEGLDLSIPPEVAFPPPGVILSEERSDESKDPFVAAHLDRVPLIPEIPPPYKRDYEAEFANYEYTPQDMELTELYNTRDYKAWDSRCKEHQRDSDRKQRRRLFRANYARYAAEAKLKNIQRAAEKLIAQRLAAEKAAAEGAAAQPQADQSEIKKPPTGAPDGSEEAKKTA